MAVIQDTLETVLTLQGVNQVSTGFGLVGAAVRSYSDALTDVQRRSLAFVAAAGITGAGLRFLGQSAAAAADDQANLTRAAGNFKGAFPEAELAAFTDHLRLLTGVSDDTTYGMLGLLGTFQITKQQAQELALPMLNAAEALKAQGVSAEQLAVQLGKAYQTGNSQALRRVGIILNDTAFSAANAEGRVRLLAEALQKQGGDAAVRFRGTMLGAQQAMTSGWHEVQEAIGSSLTGPLTSLFNQITRLEEGFLALPDSAKTTASTLAVILVGAMAAYTFGTGVALVQTIRMARELAALELQARKTAAAVSNVGSPSGSVPGAAGAAGRRGGGIIGNILGALAIPAIEAGMSGAPKQGAAGALIHSGGRIAEGAIIGSQFAGAPGAVGGAVLGALVAAIEKTVDLASGKKSAPGKDPAVAELEKVNANLQKQLDATKQLAANGGAGFAAQDVPVVIQRVGMRSVRV